MTASKHTVVQHSGFGYADDPQFEAGLESRSVTKASEVRAIEKAGGLLFDDYLEAEEFCDTAMYPEGAGMIPAAQGTFADLEIDGLKVYIPVRTVVG